MHSYVVRNMKSLKRALYADAREYPLVERGMWQSEATLQRTAELTNVIITDHHVGGRTAEQLIEVYSPDVPWVHNHFAERVSGEPLNPAMSYIDWPWHSKANADKFIRDGGTFDHTYPERFWPKYAGGAAFGAPNVGIRFEYGDLDDVIDQLKRDSWTRQAYLPIFFPEDTGAHKGGKDIRVPCTLGYHFIRNGDRLDMNYFMRSCDVTRHLHNDLWFARRLLDHVIGVGNLRTQNGQGTALLKPGEVCTFISNLHIFEGDFYHYNNSTKR